MGFSSGTFSYSGSSTSFSAPVTGTTISSTAAAAAFTETATGLSTCLLKDGTQTATAAIPLAVAGTTASSAARLDQVQNGHGSFLSSVSGTNTVTASASPTLTAYAVGQRFTFIPAGANTGATTLNINGVGAGAVQIAGAALLGGELATTDTVTVYVSAVTPVFQIVNRRPVLGTVVATTSGTSKSFTIPSWAKKITLSLQQVSADGTADFTLQLGDAGGIEATGYTGVVITTGAAAAATAQLSTSFILVDSSVAANSYSGQVILTLLDPATFTWSCFGGAANDDATSGYIVIGQKALSEALTTVNLVTTDTLDGGSINVFYE